MSADFSDQDKPDLVESARRAAPDTEGIWDQISDYFDRQHARAEAIVEKRPEAGNPQLL
jgi:hypothetical protein